MSKQSNNDGKRILILDSALKLFSQLGFQGTPTSKIAIDAGIAHGTIFHYFKTKEELILSLYEHIRNKSYEYLKANQIAGSVKENFQNLFLQSVLWGLKNQADFDFRLQFENLPYFKAIWDRQNPEVKSLHKDFNLEALQAGELKDLDINMIGSLIKSNIIGVYNYIVNNNVKTAMARRQVIDQVSELVWTMVKK